MYGKKLSSNILLLILFDLGCLNFFLLPYFSGYKLHFVPPQINHESGVRLMRGHRHLETSSGYRLVRDIIARCRHLR